MFDKPVWFLSTRYSLRSQSNILLVFFVDRAYVLKSLLLMSKQTNCREMVLQHGLQFTLAGLLWLLQLAAIIAWNRDWNKKMAFLRLLLDSSEKKHLEWDGFSAVCLSRKCSEIIPAHTLECFEFLSFHSLIVFIDFLPVCSNYHPWYSSTMEINIHQHCGELGSTFTLKYSDWDRLTREWREILRGLDRRYFRRPHSL